MKRFTDITEMKTAIAAGGKLRGVTMSKPRAGDPISYCVPVAWTVEMKP